MAPFETIPEDDVTGEDPFGNQPPPKREPDVPPTRAKRGRGKAATDTAKENVKKVSSLTSAKIMEGATGLFSRLGVTAYAYGNYKNDLTLQYDGMVIAENAEDLGKVIAQMAERSPKFKRSVERLVSATEYGAMATVVGSVVLPIAWNHNLIPFKDVVGQWIPHPTGANAPDAATMNAAEAFVQTMTGGENVANDQPPEFVQHSNHSDPLV